jgi:hypothetical protein
VPQEWSDAVSEIVRALVRNALEHWDALEWTIQGFGFARTKLGSVGRIHVWDSRLAVPLVSTMHTHPWPFRSTVVSGELLNVRFAVRDSGLPYLRSKIKTGEGGGLVGGASSVLLKPEPPEFYALGQSYSQDPGEIHRTFARDGTVTLLERPQGPPLEEADVFWPEGTRWVSAEPRPPKFDHEIEQVIDYALAAWEAQP